MPGMGSWGSELGQETPLTQGDVIGWVKEGAPSRQGRHNLTLREGCLRSHFVMPPKLLIAFLRLLNPQE